MNAATETIGPDSTMQHVLDAYPGAQRALFRKYHIGGCSHCGFAPEETLRQVCERNAGVAVDEVLNHIRQSHEEDAKVWIPPAGLAALREADPEIKLLDVRSREEYEAANIPGSILMSKDVMQQIMSQWDPQKTFVVVDHDGRQALDAAAYFMGHGYQQVRCLQGGIDAWSLEVDPKVPRYQLG